LLNRIFGIDAADTLLGRELLKVRYRALQRQIPLIYLIALSSLVGIQASSGSGAAEAWHPANLVGVAIVVRLFHWLRTSRTTPEPEAIQRELRWTFLLAGGLSLITGYWAVDFLLAGSREQQDLIILFAALTAMGCSYGITSYPAAARLPLLLLALPVAIVLIFTPSAAHVAVGICLSLIIFLTLRLQGRANVGTVELVRSRTQIEGQRQRAEAA
jgi:predicted signal transduction protein with EAL and GGDEF domain